jgi:histidinol dehydrogenase
MRINVFEWSRLSEQGRRALCRRAQADIPPEVLASVREILEAVRREGDAALVRYGGEVGDPFRRGQRAAGP